MNKLIIEIQSDDRPFLEWVQMENESWAKSREEVVSVFSTISSIDEEATMGTPPDGETPYDVAKGIEQEKSEDYNPLDMTIARQGIEVVMDPTTLKMNPAAFGMVTSYRSRITIPAKWADAGDTITSEHYNQLLSLLLEMRDSLWELQKT